MFQKLLQGSFRRDLVSCWSPMAKDQRGLSRRPGRPVAQLVGPNQRSRWPRPSGRTAVAAQQPAESFVGYHHIARGFFGGLRREHAVAEVLLPRSPDTSRSDGGFERGNRLPHRLPHSFDLGVPLRLDLGDDILDQRVGIQRRVCGPNSPRQAFPGGS